jgi:heme o synthase
MSDSKIVSGHKQFHTLSILIGVLMYLSIVIGGLLSQFGEGLSCLGGIFCLGDGSLPESYVDQLSYYHFLITIVMVPLFLWNTAIIFKHFRQYRLIFHSQIMSGLLLLAQAWLVMGENSFSAAITPIVHYSLSIFNLLLLSIVAVSSFVSNLELENKLLVAFNSRFGKLSALVFLNIIMVSLSGIIAANLNSSGVCELIDCGWNQLNFLSLSVSISIHALMVGGVGLLMLIFFREAWKTQRSQRAILTSATVLTALFFSQGFVGAVKELSNSPFYFVALHEGTSVAILAASMVMIIFVGLARRTSEEEQAESDVLIDGKERAKDFLVLTKPIVVLLLLFTTYGGMVIGAQAIPSLSLTFWTIVGGALAAGGSGAINQYIDRFVDSNMTRTSQRPIPAGRMEPAEGLAFGAGLLIIAFFMLASYVNLLAAILSLSGMFYYVILYSVFLKKVTVQNIVIGGGAGAIPPMVGWAAVTGELSLMPWLLFLIIFFWTPPHFWALALTRRGEYAAAGIPMMPVVKGVDETKRQIWIYSWVLVAITLIPVMMGLMGTIYLVGALVLGVWSLQTAYKVYSQEGNKVAFAMYRKSSMYLMYLFIVMMVDAVL